MIRKILIKMFGLEPIQYLFFGKFDMKNLG